MNRKLWFVVLAAFVVAAVLPLSGCDDDDDGPTGGLAANPAFTGTFIGGITLTQGGQVTLGTITLNLSVNSPLTGDFSIDNGTTGSINGDASGDLATFTATLDNTKCPGTVSGDIVLLDGTISLTASGEDCDGPLEVMAEADSQPEICDDKKDNDNDDLADCNDPDCAEDPACATEVCDNKVDDDGDKLFDCEDPDCAKDPACAMGICEAVATKNPSVADCPGVAPKGGCAFDVTSQFLPGKDFSCDTLCSTFGMSCVNAFDGDFTFCQPLSAAQTCSTPFSQIGGQPDMHCHCIPSA